MRLIACLLVLLTPSLVFADATINLTSDRGDATVFVKNQKVVFKSINDPNSEAIFNSKDANLYIINHQNKNYIVMNPQVIEQLSQAINTMMTALQAQFQNLPPEYREKAMQAMGQTNNATALPQSKLVAVGNKNYNGISCSESKLVQGEETIGTICFSNGNNLGLSTQDYTTLQQAQNFMFEFGQKAGKLANKFGAHPIPNIDINAINGLIIAGENTKGEEINSFKISNIIQQADEISTDLPEGYVEQKLPMEMM